MFDPHTIQMVLGAALIGGVVGLDRTALGQFMLSQPVVAGPLTGWLLGDLQAGLVIGGALELVWVLDMPIGTFVPADSTVTAVSATAIAAIGSPVPGHLPAIGFSLLLTTAMVPVTLFADHLMRRRNAQIPELAMTSSGRPTAASVTFWHLGGLVAFFLKPFLLCLALVPAGLVLTAGFLRMPDPFLRAMELYIPCVPLLGAACVARRLAVRTLDRTLLTGFAVGAVCVLILRLPAFMGVLLAAAAGWLGVRLMRKGVI